VTCFLKVFEDTEDADEAEAIKAVEKPRLFDLRVTTGFQCHSYHSCSQLYHYQFLGTQESSPK